MRFFATKAEVKNCNSSIFEWQLSGREINLTGDRNGHAPEVGQRQHCRLKNVVLALF
jgi:hypothetical protein